MARAEMVVRTISRACVPGQGRPRCIVTRLSHITTSPLRQRCRYVYDLSVASSIRR